MDQKGEAVFRIPNPQLHPDPDRVKFQELYKYRGYADARRAVVLRNFKGAWKYLAGLAAAGFVGMLYGKSEGYNDVHGFGGAGGKFLDLETRWSDDDYNYQREFQRMRYLTEMPSSGKKSEVSSYQLAELGLRETNLPAGDFKKRAPHQKYY